MIETGLLTYVVAVLGGLSLYRSATPGVVAATALAVAAALAAHTPGGWTSLAGGPGHPVWWPEVYTLGSVHTGGPHHDVYGVGLACLGLAVLATGCAGCAGWAPHEYVGLLTLLLVSSFLTLLNDHLGVLYLSLELQALTAYTLVGYHRVKVVTTESALKYLLVGSLVSGFLLVGLFGVYTGVGTFQVGELGFDLYNGSPWLVAALLFKAGAAPFHFWAPTVYESVEWPTLVGLVSYSKLNLWVLLTGVAAPFVAPGWWALAAAGAAGLAAGGVGGLYQTSVGGVLGYSAVLNSGYLLLLVAAGSDPGYVILYVGVYSVVAAGVAYSLAAGVGQLGHRAVPTLGWGLGVYYLGLNLGGLPVYPGFFPKLYLLWGLTGPAGSVVAAVAVVGFSVFGVWYYLEVASNLVLDGGPQSEPGPVWAATPVATAATAVAVGFGAEMVATPLM